MYCLDGLTVTAPTCLLCTIYDGVGRKIWRGYIRAWREEFYVILGIAEIYFNRVSKWVRLKIGIKLIWCYIPIPNVDLKNSYLVDFRFNRLEKSEF